jgi:hypothetical protein
VIATAAAFQHQGTIGVVRVKKLRHGNLFSVKTCVAMQTARQVSAGAVYFVTRELFPWQMALTSEFEF